MEQNNEEYFIVLKNMKKKMSLILEENEELKDRISSLEEELEDMRILNANVVEHSSTIEDQLEEKIEQLTNVRPKIIPEYSKNEELRKKLSLEIEKNEHLKLQNDNLLNQLEQLRFLYVSTMDHSSTLENELNDKYREASRLSITDRLTGVYNREGCLKNWDVEVERINRQGGTFSVMMFDIDYFKRVNDNYGHDVGDMVLVKIVKIIQTTIRKGDTFSRWGGEEFIIIFPGMELEEILLLADRLRQNIEESRFTGPEQVTCSFGVTGYKDDETFDETLKRVDQALYMAKRNGRNRVESIKAEESL